MTETVLSALRQIQQETALKGTSVKRILIATVVVILASLGSLAVTANAFAGSAPTVEGESVSHVTATDATVEAKINPKGLKTSYRFEIAKSPACLPVKAPYMPCYHVEVGNLPEGSIPSVSEGQWVSLDLESVGMSLEPGAIYHFRVVAANSAGEGEGQTRNITTEGPLSIDGEWATGITEHDATLDALINPNGSAATYFFKIYTDSSYNYTHPYCPFGPCDAIYAGPPLPPGLVEPEFEHLPASSSDQPVRLDLASIGANLQSGMTYHYEVVATNRQPFGGDPETVVSPDQTFTTSGVGPDNNAGGGTVTRLPATTGPDSALITHHKRSKQRHHRRKAHRHRR